VSYIVTFDTNILISGGAGEAVLISALNERELVTSQA
jgi:hypothetical protein